MSQTKSVLKDHHPVKVITKAHIQARIEFTLALVILFHVSQMRLNFYENCSFNLPRKIAAISAAAGF